jgi:DNA polymerase-3 subunit epsilon
VFAIVDIETTGGNAQYSGITEIAIILHNGETVEGKFETLIDPQQNIPVYITALTGISNYTVAGAPTFEQVAEKIYNLLNGRVFVAHNVNFDFSFIHHHLLQCGYTWLPKKLCTVRYARKVIPGKQSYGLGKLTRELNIEIKNRHRAGGDAEATVALFELLLQQDEDHKHLDDFIKGRNAHGYLPMHVPEEQINNLPYSPGVYYFHDKGGKVVYVGKAKNIKYRVRSHFSNNNPSQRKQEFIRNIYSITYQPCATELMALITEALEIKKRWPLYNRSQKRFEQMYGLYSYEDQTGLIRLAVEKKRKHLPAIHSFYRMEEGFSISRKLINLFEMQEQLAFAGASATGVDALLVSSHNIKMKAAIHHLKNNLPAFAIVQKGFDEKGREVKVGYLIDKGGFAGMGFVDDESIGSFENFKAAMQVYQDYDFVRASLHNYAERNPGEVIKWE